MKDDDQDYSVGRKPDFRLKAKSKSLNRQLEVGAAWKNPNGSITIQLESFVVLQNPSGDLLLTLFPASKK